MSSDHEKHEQFFGKPMDEHDEKIRKSRVTLHSLDERSAIIAATPAQDAPPTARTPAAPVPMVQSPSEQSWQDYALNGTPEGHPSGRPSVVQAVEALRSQSFREEAPLQTEGGNDEDEGTEKRAPRASFLEWVLSPFKSRSRADLDEDDNDTAARPSNIPRQGVPQPITPSFPAASPIAETPLPQAPPPSPMEFDAPAPATARTSITPPPLARRMSSAAALTPTSPVPEKAAAEPTPQPSFFQRIVRSLSRRSSAAEIAVPDNEQNNHHHDSNNDLVSTPIEADNMDNDDDETKSTDATLASPLGHHQQRNTIASPVALDSSLNNDTDVISPPRLVDLVTGKPVVEGTTPIPDDNKRQQYSGLNSSAVSFAGDVQEPRNTPVPKTPGKQLSVKRVSEEGPMSAERDESAPVDEDAAAASAQVASPRAFAPSREASNVNPLPASDRSLSRVATSETELKEASASSASSKKPAAKGKKSASRAKTESPVPTPIDNKDVLSTPKGKKGKAASQAEEPATPPPTAPSEAAATPKGKSAKKTNAGRTKKVTITPPPEEVREASATPPPEPETERVPSPKSTPKGKKGGSKSKSASRAAPETPPPAEVASTLKPETPAPSAKNGGRSTSRKRPREESAEPEPPAPPKPQATPKPKETSQTPKPSPKAKKGKSASRARSATPPSSEKARSPSPTKATPKAKKAPTPKSRGKKKKQASSSAARAASSSSSSSSSSESEPNLEWTVAKLKQHAEENNIDLGVAKVKKDILNVIRASVGGGASTKKTKEGSASQPRKTASPRKTSPKQSKTTPKAKKGKK